MTDNPMNTDGFEFVEFACLDAKPLDTLFTSLGFTAIGKHKTQAITLYRQGDCHFIVNAEPNSFASQFATKHGPSACGMGFRVKDAEFAYQRAKSLDAKPYEGETTHISSQTPAIYGIGDSLLYFVDEYTSKRIYEEQFEPIEGNFSIETTGAGLTFIDHLTHNVEVGTMDEWAEFYERLFNFKQVRYFDIQGKQTGLVSRAMASPCGKIKIPLNESKDKKSQIQEFLNEYNGPGIQHIAMITEDIYHTVETLRARGTGFMETPDTYYDLINKRLPEHGEDLERMRKNRILIDGGESQGGGLLLQIFTETVIGPIFFEIIQRKGNEGFGEGNFQALFESIELDQIQRGVLEG